MSDEEKLEKPYQSSPEKTLITLEQLSQTIEVMTSVVNRLRQHLSQQLEHQLLTQNTEKQDSLNTELKTNPSELDPRPKESNEIEKNAIPEVRQQIPNSLKKEKKIIH
tara:strand:+ start:111 stop:434 length:324 start_codon:yes stop_codon:yes gene_type:complete